MQKKLKGECIHFLLRRYYYMIRKAPITSSSVIYRKNSINTLSCKDLIWSLKNPTKGWLKVKKHVTKATIFAVDKLNNKYPVCYLEQVYFDDDIYEYIFKPYYKIIELLNSELFAPLGAIGWSGLTLP